jgi:hypothetical protein
MISPLRIELVSSEPTAAMQQRITRIMTDAKMLRGLTRAEVNAVYGEIEAARDALSRLLDWADYKDAGK